MDRLDAAEMDAGDARAAATAEAAQPLYVRLAHALSAAIEANRYPVGSLLPTEAELCRAFGVSRHTVREAIRHLRDRGLLSARKGVGTRVEARSAQSAYTQSLHSLSEVFQYAQETSLHVTTSSEVVAQGSLADRLGCRPGRAWLRIEGYRRAPGESRPICSTEVYIDRAFAGVGRDVGVERIAVYALIERRYGETIHEVQQDIHGALVPAEQAALLQAPPGAAALLIVRRYFGAGGRVLEISFNLHPADRFVYSMRLRRDRRAP